MKLYRIQYYDTELDQWFQEFYGNKKVASKYLDGYQMSDRFVNVSIEPEEVLFPKKKLDVIRFLNYYASKSKEVP